MGESEGVHESSPAATTWYHEKLYGDPTIVMDKEQMLQLLDSPDSDSNSMFSSLSKNSKRKDTADVPKLPDVGYEEETAEGIAANDLGSLFEQFLEYEEKQGSSRPTSPQSTCPRQDDMEVGKDSITMKNSGEHVFSGKLQDHNYAIPAFVANKEICTAGHPVTDILPNADTKEAEDGDCGLVSAVKSQEKRNMDCESELPAPVASINGHQSNRKNLQQEHEKSEQCFKCESPQHEEEDVQSRYEERSIEIEKNWKADECRREKEQKRRKRSYSSDTDDSDYDNSRYSSRRSSFHSHEKRSRSYRTSSDEESEDEYKRYSSRKYERIDTRSKRDNHSRNHRSRDHSNRLKRNEMPRNRSGRKERKEEKFIRPYDVEHERKLDFKFNRDTKESAKEERRIVYIGKILENMTKDDVWKRFRPFGPIEKVSVHIRDEGDNYAFVTYFEPESAVEAIEKGNNDSSEIKLDLSFGGRRNFCGGTYVDFDSNTSYLEEQQELLEENAPVAVSNETDFDVLLKMFQKERRKR